MVGVALELVPTSALMLGNNTSQGTAGHLKDNTPRAIVFLPGNGSPSEVQVAILGVC